MSHSIYRVSMIILYDFKKYYMKAPVISWGILFPLTIVLITGTGFGLYMYSRMIPVGFTIAVLFASTSIVHTSIAFEKMNNSINLILYLPIKSYELALAKTIGGLLYGFIGAGLAGLTYYYFSHGIVFIKPLFFITGIILGSIVFSLITLLTAYSFEPIKAIAILNIIRFTMVFIGGLLIPKPLIPPLVRPVIYLFPSTYVVDLIDYGLYNEWSYMDPLTSIIILIIYVSTLAYIASRIVVKLLTP